jgi:hypothetical protein
MTIEAMPRRDTDLLMWAENLSEKVTLPAYGVPQPLWQALTTAVTTFGNNLAICRTAQRSKGAVTTKNQSRTLMKTQARFVINSVNANPSVTDQMKQDAGITVRKQPQPKRAITTAPAITVADRTGTTMTVLLKADKSDKRRGKPADADGAALFSYVGATPPQDINAWENRGYSGQTRWEIDFASAPAGAQVWLTAFWYNARGAGPGATPVTTYVAGANMSKGTMRSGMKIAA